MVEPMDSKEVGKYTQFANEKSLKRKAQILSSFAYSFT